MKNKIIKNIFLTIIYIFMCVLPVKGAAVSEEMLNSRRKYLEEKGIIKKSIDYYIEASKIYDTTNYKRRELLELSVKEDNRNDMSYMALGAWWYFKASSATEDMKKEFFTNSLENYKMVNKLTATPVSYALSAKVYYFLGNYDEAEKMFNRMIKEQPESSLGYYGKALLEMSKNPVDMEKLLEYLLKTDKLYEKDKGWGGVEIGRVKLFKILVYRSLGNYEKSFEAFYEGYPAMTGEFTDSYLNEITDSIIKLNESIKESYPILYEKNIRKFKQLDMIN